MCANIISNVTELKKFVLENLGADEGRGENKEGSGSVMLQKKKWEPRGSLVGRMSFMFGEREMMDGWMDGWMDR